MKITIEFDGPGAVANAIATLCYVHGVKPPNPPERYEPKAGPDARIWSYFGTRERMAVMSALAKSCVSRTPTEYTAHDFATHPALSFQSLSTTKGCGCITIHNINAILLKHGCRLAGYTDGL